jgi:microcystin-dependent protein
MTLPRTTLLNIVDIQGAFPKQDGGGDAINTMAMVHHFAGPFETGGFNADGRLLEEVSHVDLGGCMGGIYGGDDAGFNLPDLRSYAAIGVSEDQTGTRDPVKLTLGMTWMICVQGDALIETSPSISMLRLMSARFAPVGWLPADGRLLPIADYRPLFELLGTVYGGDGVVEFGLPDLTDRTPVGMGLAPDGSLIEIGQKVDGAGGVDGLGLNFLIAGAGVAPARQPGGSFDPYKPFIGEILIVATLAPVFNAFGWFPAAGQLMAASADQPLFQVLGNAWGGNGVRTFALPNLQGQVIVGAVTPD